MMTMTSHISKSRNTIMIMVAMVGEMVQNLQIPYSFTFNNYVVIQHVYKFTFNDIFLSSYEYIYLQLQDLHSHSRSKMLFNTVIFIQQIVNVLKFTNSMFLHIERFNSFSRIHSFTFKVKNFIQHSCNIYSTFYAHPSLRVPRLQPALSFGNRRPTMVIWRAPVRRCLREEIRTFNGGAQVF